MTVPTTAPPAELRAFIAASDKPPSELLLQQMILGVRLVGVFSKVTIGTWVVEVVDVVEVADLLLEIALVMFGFI